MSTYTAPSSATQTSLFDDCPVLSALQELAEADAEERGAVFTRREIVDFILNLAGYTPDRSLHTLRFLEPSFGSGDFLLPAIERLLTAWANAGSPDPESSLSRAIRGVEIHRKSFTQVALEVRDLLDNHGITKSESNALLNCWLVEGDFLLSTFDQKFDVAAGNPPYVRQERIPDALIAEYRSRYKTIYDRADLYVPFIERSLDLLAPQGRLGFICADRWMKNRYGGPLRQYIEQGFWFRAYVDMVDTKAFKSDVIAYPGISVIERAPAGCTRIANRPDVSAEVLGPLAEDLLAPELNGSAARISEISLRGGVTQPWVLEASEGLGLVRRLEASYPLIEDAGCKVGIGVATGADKAFIAPFESLEVEQDRKLPLATTKDIVSGEVKWRGYGIINPFSDDGELVDLNHYPQLSAYLESRRDIISKRHVARKAPANWYRTIDRIYPSLAYEPKLLIPDIKGAAHIVYEEGQLYPHHNLYYITSRDWDLRALQAVLMSGIASLFVSTYSTKMRGGYLRFQAQYLRRIRLPLWDSIELKTRDQLIAASRSENVDACNMAVSAVYGLHEEDLTTLAAFTPKEGL